MKKQVALLKTKPGMSHADFIARYENGHVPLISKVMPVFAEYRRSFIVPGSVAAPAHVTSSKPSTWFDVITELWFSDQGKIDEMKRLVTETDAGEKIAEDETHLFDRSKMMMLGVTEMVTDPAKLAPRPVGHRGPPEVKLVFFMRRKPGMSEKDFIDYYENRHAALAVKLLARDGVPLLAGYHRSYPLAGETFAIGEAGAVAPARDFDVMTELWLWSKADYQPFVNFCAQADIAEAMSIDEANLFDRSSIKMMLAEEHITLGRPAS